MGLSLQTVGVSLQSLSSFRVVRSTCGPLTQQALMWVGWPRWAQVSPGVKGCWAVWGENSVQHCRCVIFNTVDHLLMDYFTPLRNKVWLSYFVTIKMRFLSTGYLQHHECPGWVVVLVSSLYKISSLINECIYLKLQWLNQAVFSDAAVDQSVFNSDWIGLWMKWRLKLPHWRPALNPNQAAAAQDL